MKIKYYLATILLSVLAISPAISHASGSAGISLSPLSGSFIVGKTFNMVISVNPGSEKIDTVRAKLNFPSDLLEIKNFSTSQIFSYQTGSNSFDNSAGTFSYGAGTPGGVTSPVNFGTITFIVKKSGNANIAILSDSLVLSAGENKFNGQLSSASFTFDNTSAISAKPVAKNSNQIVEKKATSPEVIKTSAENNVVETQILTKQQTKNLSAGLSSSFPFAITIKEFSIGAVILIIALMGFMIFKFARKENN